MDDVGLGARTAIVDGLKRTINGHRVTPASALIDFLGAAVEQPIEDRLGGAGVPGDVADLTAKGARHLIANLDYGRRVFGVAALEVASRELQEAFIAHAAEPTPRTEAEWHAGAAVHAAAGFVRRFVVDTILTGNPYLALATGALEAAILLRDYHLSVPFPEPARRWAVSPGARWAYLGGRYGGDGAAWPPAAQPGW